MRFPCPHPYLRYIQKGLVSSERGKDYAHRKLSERQHQTMIDVSWGEKERSPYQRHENNISFTLSCCLRFVLENVSMKN